MPPPPLSHTHTHLSTKMNNVKIETNCFARNTLLATFYIVHCGCRKKILYSKSIFSSRRSFFFNLGGIGTSWGSSHSGRKSEWENHSCGSHSNRMKYTTKSGCNKRMSYACTKKNILNFFHERLWMREEVWLKKFVHFMIPKFLEMGCGHGGKKMEY